MEALASAGFSVPAFDAAAALPVVWATAPSRDYQNMEGRHFVDAEGREYLRVVRDSPDVHYLDGEGRELFRFSNGFSDRRYYNGEGRELFRITGTADDRHYGDGDGRDILRIWKDWEGVHYCDGDGRDVWHEWNDWTGRHVEGDSAKLAELMARVTPQAIVALVPALDLAVARAIADDLAGR